MKKTLKKQKYFRRYKRKRRYTQKGKGGLFPAIKGAEKRIEHKLPPKPNNNETIAHFTTRDLVLPNPNKY
jgi:hypothetical protein